MRHLGRKALVSGRQFSNTGTQADLIQNHKVPTQLVIIITQAVLGDALESQGI